MRRTPFSANRSSRKSAVSFPIVVLLAAGGRPQTPLRSALLDGAVAEHAAEADETESAQDVDRPEQAGANPAPRDRDRGREDAVPGQRPERDARDKRDAAHTGVSGGARCRGRKRDRPERDRERVQGRRRDGRDERGAWSEGLPRKLVADSGAQPRPCGPCPDGDENRRAQQAEDEPDRVTGEQRTDSG